MSNPPVIFVPRERAELDAAHKFHIDNVGEFLLPRDIGQFDALAEAGQLWIAVVDGEVVAACYVTREDEATDAEFGGVIVRADHQKTGLASAVGTVAIAAHAVQDAAHRLIAHVHVDNDKPIDLLTKRLGFSKLDGEPAELKKADLEAHLGHPITMKADEHGIIRGNTFEFSRAYLAELADRLASGKLAKVTVTIQNRFFEGDALAETVDTLRHLAADAAAAAPGSQP